MRKLAQHGVVGPGGSYLSFLALGLESEVRLSLLTDVSVQAQAWASVNSASGHADR